MVARTKARLKRISPRDFKSANLLNWIGDSKIVTSEGAPCFVYHGSSIFGADGKGVKYHDFGGGSDFFTKVGEMQSAAGLEHTHETLAWSELHEVPDYLKGTMQEGGSSSWRHSSSERPSSAFRRAVDNLLVPYAKAVGSEGDRFSPSRFAERFDLTEEELDNENATQKRNAKMQRKTQRVNMGSKSEQYGTFCSALF